MLVHHLLENTAQKFPDKPAVWYRDRWMSYGEIDEKANRLARFLRENGVRRGDRVCLLLDNSPEYVISYYAILKADGVVVALNTDTTVDSLRFLIDNCDARVVLAARKYYRFLVPALKETPGVALLIGDAPVPEQAREGLAAAVTTFDAVLAETPATPVPSRNIDSDLSAIIYTSGSTGEPKGVMLSHLNTVANTHSIVRYLQLTSDDRIMVVLPFYYVYGKTLLNTHVLAGGSVVIDNRFTYPNVVLDTMKQQEATGFAGVPSTFMLLLNKSKLRDVTPFPALRYVTQAGGHMAVPVQEQVVEAFAPAKLVIMYGATELAPRLTWLPPEQWERKKGSIGISIPNTEAFVADDAGNRLPPAETGEIVGRGSNVMMGYWKDPEGTAKVLRHGLYYTGDLGAMDEEGYLFVVGRSKDMLKIGGNRASAKEIEDAILEIPHVHEVAVIGVEDPVLGEAPKACVVLKKEERLADEELRRMLSRRLPPYKIPKFVEFRESLPKNQSGKILKAKLREGG